MHTFKELYGEYRDACRELIAVYQSQTASCRDAVNARIKVAQKRHSLLVVLEASCEVFTSDAFQLIELEQELSRVTGLATSLYPNLPKSLARYLWKRTRERLENKFSQWLKVCAQRASTKKIC